MKLEDVLNLGPAERKLEITGNDGEKKVVKVFLKPLSFALIMKSSPEEDKDAALDILAERIAYSVCDEKGKPLFTKDQIKGTSDKSLGADIVLALMGVVNEFNNFSSSEGKAKGK